MHTSPWDKKSIAALFDLPFLELIYQAHGVHIKNFDPKEMELCTLCNIKTGACPEDCGYCAQSGHHKTGLKKENFVDIEKVIEQAKLAKQRGARRFCMGAAWRNPPKAQFPKVLEMIKQVKALGLETCVTLGMLDQEQSLQLKEAGLDFYNHNLDTSPEHYGNITSTRTYQDRLDTLKLVEEAGIHVCCGGIMGMGETRDDRVSFLYQLTQLATPPTSVPINKLVPVPGTPLANAKPIDDFEFIRTIAVARILLTTSVIRLSAGRDTMADTMQAWCFMAGANSIFYGDYLLTVVNPDQERDLMLLKKLGMKPTKPIVATEVDHA